MTSHGPGPPSARPQRDGPHPGRGAPALACHDGLVIAVDSVEDYRLGRLIGACVSYGLAVAGGLLLRGIAWAL